MSVVMNADADAGSMTASRNTRRYTLRNVQSSPKWSFFERYTLITMLHLKETNLKHNGEYERNTHNREFKLYLKEIHFKHNGCQSVSSTHTRPGHLKFLPQLMRLAGQK